MVALRQFDIFLALLEIRYVAVGNECRLRRTFVTFLALPDGQRISSALAPYRAEGYIERRISGAYRRRADVRDTRRTRRGRGLQKVSIMIVRDMKFIVLG